MRILGLDPGFASFGYAVLNVDEPTAPRGALVEVLGELQPRWPAIGVHSTKPDKSARSKADDSSRRTRELWRFLRLLDEEWRPAVIAVEAVAFPAGRVQFSVVSHLGRARALVDVLAEQRQVQLVELRPGEVRKLLGLTDKGKDATRLELERRWPGLSSAWGSLTKREHEADACAVAVAALARIESARE